MQLLESKNVEDAYTIYNAPGFKKSFASFKTGYNAELPSHSPVNIAYGNLGQCLFVLELYKLTHDKTILNNLLTQVEQLEKHRLRSKTNNHSLFYGSSGLTWFYLQLYRETKNDEFLGRAVHIIKGYHSPGSGHLKINDNSGLVSGITGIILCYLHLFHETREDWIRVYIEKYVLFLTGKSCLTEKGIYWNDPYHENNTHSGWAFGTAGVAICLLQLACYFNNPGLATLANRALLYEDEWMERKTKNNQAKKTEWNDTHLDGSLYQGRLGKMLAGLYADVQNGQLPNENYWKEATNAFSRLICSGAIDKMSPHFFNGLAGWGLAYTDAYSLTGNYEYLDMSNRIAGVVSEKIAGTTVTQDTGFFNGLSGIGYFLARVANPTLAPSLLLPVLPGKMSGKNEPSATLNITQPAINELVLKRNFRDTFWSLNKEFPAETEAFITNQGMVNPELFKKWLTGFCSNKQDNEAVDEILISLEKEMTIADLKWQSHGLPADDDMQFVQKLETVLKFPDNEFLQQWVTIPERAYIFRYEPTIDLSAPLNGESLLALFEEYGHESCFLRVNKFNGVDVVRLGLHRLYVDQFIQPATVETVINILTGYMLNQDESIVAMIQAHLEATDMNDLKNKLQQFVYKGIKDLLMLGVLIVVDEPAK